MATELSKPVTRRIGDLVVTIGEQGISLKPNRAQKSLFLSYDKLISGALDRKDLTDEEKAVRKTFRNAGLLA